MQSRILADTDLVFVMSTNMKTVLLLDWKIRKESLQIRVRVAAQGQVSLGTGRPGEGGPGFRFVEIGSTSVAASCWTLGAWKQLFDPPGSLLC